MKKFSIPQFPVAGNFEDQREFEENARRSITQAIDGAESVLGVVHEGIGGGYFVSLENDEYYQHPVDAFVYIFRPAKEYANAAEVMAEEWRPNPREIAYEQRAWKEALEEKDFNLSAIPVSYIFEDEAEAQAWLDEVGPFEAWLVPTHPTTAHPYSLRWDGEKFREGHRFDAEQFETKDEAWRVLEMQEDNAQGYEPRVIPAYSVPGFTKE